MLQTITILLENKPGALLRVTGVLSARGYNIETLTVAKTLDPELSRMTITVDVDDRLRGQVVKQLLFDRRKGFALPLADRQCTQQLALVPHLHGAVGLGHVG